MIERFLSRFSHKGDVPAQATEQDEQRDLRAVIETGEKNRRAALRWRVLSVLQFPITLICLFYMLVWYAGGETIMKIPARPDPTILETEDLPDPEFVNVAVQFLNLVATYQPFTAREQFETARKLLADPASTEFEKTYIDQELPTIEESGRSGLFTFDINDIETERDEKTSKVSVRVPGLRQQFVGKNELPRQEMVYYFDLSVMKDAPVENYGILIVDIAVKEGRLDQINAEDRKKRELRQAQSGEKGKKTKKKKNKTKK